MSNLTLFKPVSLPAPIHQPGGMPVRGNAPSTDPKPDQLAQCREKYGVGTDSHDCSEITDQLPVPTLTLTNKCEHNKQTTMDHQILKKKKQKPRARKREHKIKKTQLISHQRNKIDIILRIKEYFKNSLLHPQRDLQQVISSIKQKTTAVKKKCSGVECIRLKQP